MNYGLIIPTKVVTKEDGAQHVLGSANLAERVINPSGDWEPYAPDREPQNVGGVETNACTYYGTLSALETLDRFLGEPTNYSDRYAANVGYQLGKINPASGANPHDTAEVIRKDSGLVSEDEAPWGVPYYTLDTEPLKPRALKWYEKRKLAHKWIFVGNDKTAQEKRALLQDALTKGAVCVSVAAWHKKNGLFYKPKGATDNHWLELLSAIGTNPYRALDSYDTYIKELHPEYDFYMAKVYFYRPLPFKTSLAYRQTHPEVARLQGELRGLGYSIPNGITPYYGRETRAAVFQFQHANGIEDDGTHFGPRTRNALNKTLNPDTYFGGSFSTFLEAIFAAH